MSENRFPPSGDPNLNPEGLPLSLPDVTTEYVARLAADLTVAAGALSAAAGRAGHLPPEQVAAIGAGTYRKAVANLREVLPVAQERLDQFLAAYPEPGDEQEPR